MALTPQEELELIEIELEQRRRTTPAPAQEAPASAAPLSQRQQNWQDLKALPGRVAQRLEQEYAALQQRGWQNLSPSERATAMAMSLPVSVSRMVSSFTEAAPEMAMRAAPVMVGQKVGEAIRIPGAANFLGALGGVGGEYAALKSEGKDISQNIGNLVNAAIIGATRGKPMAGRGVGDTLAEAQRMGVVNTIGGAADTLIDEGTVDVARIGKDFVMGAASVGAERVLDSGRGARRTAIREADNTVVDDTIQASSQAGYKIHDRAARPDTFEQTTNKLVRKDIGVPETAPLSQKTINDRIKQLEEVYEQTAQLSDHARASLKGYKDARANAKKLWKRYYSSQDTGKPDMALQDAAKEFDRIADEFEAQLFREAELAGQPELFQQLIETRPKLAKVHLADRALNPSRGVVEAKVYGDALTNGARLTGEAKIIADTFNANLMKERQIGSLLSRELTIAKWLLNQMEASPVGQAYLTTRPSYRQYPDAVADAVRLSIMQQSPQVEAPEAVSSFVRLTQNPAPFSVGVR